MESFYIGQLIYLGSEEQRLQFLLISCRHCLHGRYAQISSSKLLRAYGFKAFFAPRRDNFVEHGGWVS